MMREADDKRGLRPHAVILAGGLGRRMGGGQKGLRMLGPQPLIGHVIARLAPQAGALAISANAPGYESFGLPILPDPVAGHPGPLAGVLAGLLWLRDRARESGGGDGGADGSADGGTEGGTERGAEGCRGPRGAGRLLTAAADTPFFPADLVARLAAAAPDPRQLVLARSPAGEHPLFALWPMGLQDDLATWLEAGGRRVRDFCARHAPAYCDFAAAESRAPDPFFNINRPEDLARAEDHLASGSV